MARVGIGVPVYNGGLMLADSLECLRTQSFEDFEVVIGDNASDDETADICADFAARDNRFRHLRRPENLGSLPNFQDLRRQSDAQPQHPPCFGDSRRQARRYNQLFRFTQINR